MLNNNIKKKQSKVCTDSWYFYNPMYYILLEKTDKSKNTYTFSEVWKRSYSYKINSSILNQPLKLLS